MKRYRLLPLTLALALLLTACGPNRLPADQNGSDSAPGSAGSASEPPPTPVNTPFALAAYPAYRFHPVLTENRANLTLAPLLYEPLFHVDGSFQAVPALCQSYAVSEDKLTWTFTLQNNVSFSDGAPLTGPAVADALNTARAPGARYAQRLASVASITGAEQTVTVVLSQPHGDLPLLLDIPIALGAQDRPAGTGPYILTETEGILFLSARPDWWQSKRLPAQKIPLTAAAKSDDLISAFAAGNIGLVDVDLMGTNALGYSGSYESWDYATTDLLYLGFNARKGPCRNAETRKALASGVDRTAITQIDYASHATAASLPCHPKSPLYHETLAAGLGYEPERLADALTEQRLTGRKLVLLVNSENSSKLAAARRIAYQLEAAGLEVQLNHLDFEHYQTALAAGDFDLYLGETVLTADFDLTALLSPTGTLNYGGWLSEEIPGLLDAMRQSSPAERPAATQALYALLLEEVPIVPVCFKNGSVLTQWGRLSGLNPVRNDVFYQLENWTIS